MWGRLWLPEAAQAGCHTILKDSSINKLSICCQQPPFGLCRERELWCGDLALPFRGISKNKARGRCLPVCSSATDLGMQRGCGLRGGRRRAFQITSRRREDQDMKREKKWPACPPCSLPGGQVSEKISKCPNPCPGRSPKHGEWFKSHGVILSVRCHLPTTFSKSP